MDRNSVSKISTFSIDSNSSTLSLRLIGRQSFTDKQKQSTPTFLQGVIKQHEEEDDECESDGETTERCLKIERAISYEELKK